MRVAMTGSSGLIGTALRAALAERGHVIPRLVRDRERASQPAHAYWNPTTDEIDAPALEGHDVVIHLAGENVAGLWTWRKKQKIRESRVRGTTLLARTLAVLEQRPQALLSASAIGYYGDRSAREALDEHSVPGSGFLAGVGVEWEQANRAAEAAGMRVVCMRFGIVLSKRGGMLGLLLPLFRLGLGARLGHGDQIVSWITIDDVAHAALHALEHPALRGPVNFVAPETVTNKEFVRTIGRVLRRPTPFVVPEMPVRLLFPVVAEELLFTGSRVVPRKLLASGYSFRQPELEPALRALLA